MPLNSMRSAKQKGHRHILSAARELILELGADKVSLRSVATRAGYSPASIYEYFASKEELFKELAHEVLARLDARMAKVPTHLSPQKRLIRYATSYVAFARDNPEDYLLVFAKFRTKRTSSNEEFASESPYARLLKTVQQGTSSGIFRKDRKNEEIAYGLWALAHGLAMLQLTHLQDYEADFEVWDRLAIKAYVAGLAKNEED